MHTALLQILIILIFQIIQTRPMYHLDLFYLILGILGYSLHVHSIPDHLQKNLHSSQFACVLQILSASGYTTSFQNDSLTFLTYNNKICIEHKHK